MSEQRMSRKRRAAEPAVATDDKPTAANLRDAAEDGDIERCARLIKAGANQEGDATGVTPLHIAARKGFREVCELLIKDGPGLINAEDEEGNTPLHIAVLANRVLVVELLLARHASWSVENRWGRTPLNEAAHSSYECYNACVVLLDAGAKCTPDRWEATPLHGAAELNDVEMAELLLDYGATMEPDNTGETPLHRAVATENEQMCHFLLNKGATHIPDKDGNTPLHVAVGVNNAGICKILVQRGACPTAKNNEGRTPLQDAEGNEELMKALQVSAPARPKTMPSCVVECPICMINAPDHAFGCGHMICGACLEGMHRVAHGAGIKCYVCRVPVATITKCYLPVAAAGAGSDVDAE
jgi:ankyrin repeat protein